MDAANESRPRVVRGIEVLPYGDPVSPPGASVPFLTFVYTRNTTNLFLVDPAARVPGRTSGI
jgi:hypothetical protein